MEENEKANARRRRNVNISNGIHSCLEPVAMQVDTERTSIFIVHHSSFYFGRLWGGKGEFVSCITVEVETRRASHSFHFNHATLTTHRHVNQSSKSIVVSDPFSTRPLPNSWSQAKAISRISRLSKNVFENSCEWEKLAIPQIHQQPLARQRHSNSRLDWTFRVSLR